MLELINVNPNSGEPIYRQLHEQIVRLIVGGQLQAEEVLPSVRQMAEALAVNPMTVSRAIQGLVEQGWLERRRGQATKVAVRTQDDSQSIDKLLSPQCLSLIEQATQLGLSLEDVQALLATHWHRQNDRT